MSFCYMTLTNGHHQESQGVEAWENMLCYSSVANNFSSFRYRLDGHATCNIDNSAGQIYC